MSLAAEPGRMREVLIWVAFAVLCAVAVVTVILPEGTVEEGDDPPAPTQASAAQPVPQ